MSLGTCRRNQGGGRAGWWKMRLRWGWELRAKERDFYLLIYSVLEGYLDILTNRAAKSMIPEQNSLGRPEEQISSHHPRSNSFPEK